MKVVIVESPNKCETIKKYLGQDYNVLASYGHVRDLATSGKGGLGVDCENNFKPTYKIIKNKIGVVNDIKSQVKDADEVILATDPDREGEAIAWHLKEVLKLPNDNKRLEFHEITRESITNAIRNPRTINMDLVASQEARRIIDRIIGFKLSDVLQRKNNLRSGGRVQSATLKMIVDHEKEIKAFVPKEYFALSLKIKKNNIETEIPLYKYKNQEYSGDKRLEDKALSEEILAATKKGARVLDIITSTKTVNPKAPYKTSTLQQDAISKLGLSASKVNRILQELYEGISLGGEHVGLITYIRTDSSYLAETYVERTRNYIKERFGEAYVAKNDERENKSNGVLAQNAHEAIRPTSNHRTPSTVRQYLNNSQYRVYQLIYNHTLSYLMSSKKLEETSIVIGNEDVQYKLSAHKTIFPGYEILTGRSDNQELPFELTKEENIEIVDAISTSKFTTPPPHYTEAKIIKLMEEKGIGRPSTYSSTISTLQNRTYVIKDKNSIVPTENGIKAIDFLEKNFKDFVETEFTAELEKDLDEIKDGEVNRNATISKIYKPFMNYYDEAMKLTLGDCPLCHSPLKVIKGRYGSFIGCSNYPTCKYKKVEEKAKPELLDKLCPECGHQLVKRTNKKGKSFIACSNFPNCHYIEGKKNEPKKLEIMGKCPDCEDGNLVIRKAWNKAKKQMGYFLGCTNFPKCRHFEEYNPDPNNTNDD